LYGVQIVSPEAAFMINEILTQATRPDLPNNYQSSYHVPKVAWKTGTSYGRRDAWSIGYNARYTVGVWIGNASGEGVRELTGADIATPLLFSIFNAIDYNSASRWFTAPKELKFRLVCAWSGLVPGDFCEHQVADYYIPLVSGTQKCTHLKEIAVKSDESHAYCTSCLPQSGYKKKIYPNPTPELIAYYDNTGVAYQKIPPHNPACTRIFDSQAPLIVSPVNGREYILDSESAELMLSCQADNEVKTVYWYINDRFYSAASASEKVFFKPGAGPVKISCSDDKGRNSDVKIVVREE
jgi:penicillin-binding protein 1C